VVVVRLLWGWLDLDRINELTADQALFVGSNLLTAGMLFVIGVNRYLKGAVARAHENRNFKRANVISILAMINLTLGMVVIVVSNYFILPWWWE
jgi:energy-converting hydrogenase Eha subunit C